uniref:Ig-like domain-containing protein n=1 Tax=Chrysemys picta bellii TaxID=8478 RepID=A0A8C3IVA8_CHRPI
IPVQSSPSPACSLLPGAGAQEFQLLQPQGAVWVSPGETLTLICSQTGLLPVGPTKWFKGSGSGRQLVYAGVGSFPRVTLVVNHSDTDFTIRISDIRPEDAGIYRCVKFDRGSGADEEFRSGAGTVVSVRDKPPARSILLSLVLSPELVAPSLGEHNSSSLNPLQHRPPLGFLILIPQP